ncbi:MAG: hypothetical protein KC561_07405 [Myxococcales bacterium]|nr:hypothetical protein [Myxococcales bacterium]
MNRMKVLFAAAALSLLAASCVEDVSGVSNPADSTTNQQQQTVTLEPVFVIEGLDELPVGLHLDELRLGIGAIFLDRIDSEETGIAFANRDPFQLRYAIGQGHNTDSGPSMTLPEGGTYQISVQLEPQILDTDVTRGVILDVDSNVLLDHLGFGVGARLGRRICRRIRAGRNEKREGYSKSRLHSISHTVSVK